MKVFGNYFWFGLWAALVFGHGCSSKNSDPVKDTEAFASPSQLIAVLTNGNIILHWKNNSTAEGGNWVEFTTSGSEYTKLGVFMSYARATNFLHPRVAPQTTFIYHILPFFGEPSQAVGITTSTPTNNMPELEEGPIASANSVSSDTNSGNYSLRTMNTFIRAAPADLTAALSSPTSVDLHWTDRALGEDGYYVEIGPKAEGEFKLCAFLPPNATSFRKTGLPPESKCYFRVRAYFYGKPSDTVSVPTSAH